MDGEFAQLKPNGIDLLSIALIKPSGEELYLEIDYRGKIDPWVIDNVLPYMGEKKVSKKEAVKKINAFIGTSKPSLIAYVNQFDWMGICKLFKANTPTEIHTKLPFHWLPLDFASVLFAKGILLRNNLSLEDVAKSQGIDILNFREHYALDDARVLKKLYEKLMY